MQSLDQENYAAVSALQTHARRTDAIWKETEAFPKRAELVANRYRLTTQFLDTPQTRLYVAMFDGFAHDGKELLATDQRKNVVESLSLLSSVLYQRTKLDPQSRGMLETYLNNANQKHLATLVHNTDIKELESRKNRLGYQATEWTGQLGEPNAAAQALERVIDLEAAPLPILPDTNDTI